MTDAEPPDTLQPPPGHVATDTSLGQEEGDPAPRAKLWHRFTRADSYVRCWC